MAPTATEQAQTVVYLGNRKGVEIVDDPDDVQAAAAEGRAANQIRRPLPRGKSCTRVVLAPGLTLIEAINDITQPQRGVWQAHSDADSPAWVASTDPALAQFLATHWRCELREPEPDDVPADTAGDATTGAE